MRNDEEVFQVSESPLQTKAMDCAQIYSDEVVFDTPSCPTRTGNLLDTQITFEEAEDPEIAKSPGFETKDDNFPPSPPPSRPMSALFMHLPSHPAEKTPILYPGNKKVYTPRPSHTVFPDTPTLSPVLSQHQSLVVKGWKERFLHHSASSGPFTPKSSDTPRLGNTISSRPITPLHTPLLRRRLPNDADSLRVHTKSIGGSPVTDDRIEDSPPSKERSNLDRFRFHRH
jgi:hypothetical protein